MLDISYAGQVHRRLRTSDGKSAGCADPTLNCRRGDRNRSSKRHRQLIIAAWPAAAALYSVRPGKRKIDRKRAFARTGNNRGQQSVQFERADVTRVIAYITALVTFGGDDGVSLVDGRTKGLERNGQSRASVVLQPGWIKQGVGITTI